MVDEFEDEPITLADALHTISVLKKKIGKQDQELKDKVAQLELDLQRLRSVHGKCVSYWQIERTVARRVRDWLALEYELED